MYTLSSRACARTTPTPPPVTSTTLVRGEYLYDGMSPTRRSALERWHSRTDTLMQVAELTPSTQSRTSRTFSSENETCETDDDSGPYRRPNDAKIDALRQQLDEAAKRVKELTDLNSNYAQQLKQRSPEVPCTEQWAQTTTQSTSTESQTEAPQQPTNGSIMRPRGPSRVHFGDAKKKLDPEQHKQAAELYDGLCMLSSCAVKRGILCKVLKVQGATADTLLRGLECGVNGSISNEDLEAWLASLPNCTALLNWLSEEVSLQLEEDSRTDGNEGLYWLSALTDTEGVFALPALSFARGRKLPTVNEYAGKVRELDACLEEEKLRCELYEQRAAYADVARCASNLVAKDACQKSDSVYENTRLLSRRQSGVSLKDQVSCSGEATELDSCMALLRGSLKDLKTDAGGLALLTKSVVEDDDNW